MQLLIVLGRIWGMGRQISLGLRVLVRAETTRSQLLHKEPVPWVFGRN